MPFTKSTSQIDKQIYKHMESYKKNLNTNNCINEHPFSDYQLALNLNNILNVPAPRRGMESKICGLCHGVSVESIVCKKCKTVIRTCINCKDYLVKSHDNKCSQ